MGWPTDMEETPPVYWPKCGGGFSVLELLFVVAQKCEWWYTKNEKGQPPTRWVARLVKMEIPPYRSAKV